MYGRSLGSDGFVATDVFKICEAFSRLRTPPAGTRLGMEIEMTVGSRRKSKEQLKKGCIVARCAHRNMRMLDRKCCRLWFFKVVTFAQTHQMYSKTDYATALVLLNIDATIIGQRTFVRFSISCQSRRYAFMLVQTGMMKVLFKDNSLDFRCYTKSQKITQSKVTIGIGY